MNQRITSGSAAAVQQYRAAAPTLGDEDQAAALAAPQSLRFTIWACDTDTSETFFTADVTL